MNSKAQELRRLHSDGSGPLLLPTVWDVTGARAAEAAGFSAVATTSDGIASTLGYGGRESAPRDEMLAAAARIVRSVPLPVTVDLEGGYGLGAEEIVRWLTEVGAAGCNIEDSLHARGSLADVEEQAERIAGIRAAAGDTPLVVNARIDTFLRDRISGGGTPEAELVAETLQRAEAYLAAGADCVFPILASGRETVGELVGKIPGPVNILCLPGGLSVRELADLGVARISWGPFIHDHAREQLLAHLTQIRRAGAEPGGGVGDG
ncbi:isocitrate lyase/phosphoenolpyruvate mutase family protein [Thermobifida halotolerans]|uniref:Isocitrate lyase/phosphoenolpyruvate mutase family protein n=1 Tax=Thermobifida halotolerans TaxID=483545 RepID=A0A399FUF0_9ACTN|nr:isocitrate lyase/phosphoenolpyruvate mutase family protein [Thermobifida halotolerans]UOE18882.1 isocitrate lyase/phosphoenolpyruvate mutase family protein [Thermobifida halotolerans]